MIRLQRILFPTDFSPRADEALRHAAFMARRHGAELHILHVTELPPTRHASGPDEGDPDFRRRLETRVDQIRREFGADDVQTVTRLRTGDAPGPGIIHYAEDEAIDLIVIGTHGRRGVRRMILGSTTEEVLRTAPCSVYTIRQSDELPAPRVPRSVLVPIDFSEYGMQALRAAAQFVTEDGEIHLIHAVEEYVPPGVYGLEYPSYHELTAEIEQGARNEMHRMAQQVLGERIRHVIAILTGYAPSAIIEYAEESDVDLIVMSTHGRSGIERVLLGSITEKVVRSSDCPVLTVRAMEHSQS